jgi:hypothetical protein
MTRNGHQAALQHMLAQETPSRWVVPDRFLVVGARICFPRSLSG